jgi:hypothetical protein
MTDDEPFVTIRAQTGNFNLADPSETTVKVKVEIPAYDFDHEFTFDERKMYDGIDSEKWDYALDTIVDTRPKHIGDRDPRERLETILDEHEEEIHEAWKEHRKEQIDYKIEKLEADKRKL